MQQQQQQQRVRFARIRGRIVPIRNQPKSAGKGYNLATLRRLRQDNFHNPSTGLELNEGEAIDKIHRLEQRAADRKVKSEVNRILTQQFRSRGRPWIPEGKVTFKWINGHVVPFRKKAEDPFL